MIRKSKIMGLAIVAVLAMSALGASAAQAVPVITTSVSPVGVHGTGEGTGEAFTIDGVTFECKVSHYTGTATSGSSTLTLHPTYTECGLKGTSISMTMDTTGCNYVFHATEKVAEGSYKAHVDVGCEAGKEIKITAATCAFTIPAQTGLQPGLKSHNRGRTTAQDPLHRRHYDGRPFGLEQAFAL